MALKIGTDGAIEDLTAEARHGLTLEQVRAAIDGGWIEAVRLERMPEEEAHDAGYPPEAEPWLYLMVDEEGRLKELPINAIASGLAKRLIVGPALLVVMSYIGQDEETIR